MRHGPQANRGCARPDLAVLRSRPRRRGAADRKGGAGSRQDVPAGMSSTARILFWLLLLALLAGATQPFWKRLLPPPAAQPVDDFGPCYDRRPQQPDAPDIPGLNPRTLLFSSDCRWLVAGNQNGSIQLIERRSGKLLAEAAAHAFRVENLLISPDDK